MAMTHALREALALLLLLALPPALAIGLVAVVMALVQSATHVHERTLSTVPKIVVALLALAACGPWIAGHLVTFTRALLEAIPALGRS